jgi:hypothetical protein
MNAGIQRNLTSGLAGWFVEQVRRWGRSSERDGSLQQSSDGFTPIPSRAAEFGDQFGF